MNNRILLAILVSTVLLLGILAPTTFAPQPPVDPNTLIFGTVGMPTKADPATAYDTASGALIMNVYEPLIDFARNTSESDPRKQGLLGEFVPRLAKNLPTKEVVILDLHNLTVVNQTDPKSTIWEDTTGKFYHINGWRDNNVTEPDNNGTLGPDDVVYMEEINASMPPYEWIPCTKFAWQVKLKEHIGLNVHLMVKRTWYIFELRTGVSIHPWKFYNGTLAPAANITCVDVEYSFERAMVQDRVYGPIWMLYKPILDAISTDDGWNISDVNDLTDLAHLIDCAIQQNCTHIKINVGIDFPEIAWYQILAQTWGCIVPKAFSIDHGCWPGTFFNASGYPHWIYWRRWPTISRSPLDRAPTKLSPLPGAPDFNWAGHAEPPPVMRGTGPYVAEAPAWVADDYWRIDKYDQYWKGWAPDPEHPYYVNTYISRNIPSWTDRKSAFLNGDIDIIAVPIERMFDLMMPNPTPPPDYIPLPGIVCYKDFPLLLSDALHFVFDVAPSSSWIPIIRGYGMLQFFGNVHARKAFSYALNFTELIEWSWLNEAEQPATWHMAGLVPDFRDPSIVKYDINLTKVREELEAAIYNVTGTPESLWDSGFSTIIPYDSGNLQRRIVCEMIESVIESLNAERPGKPAFVIDVIALPWILYESAIEAKELPCFQMGWLADFADADNWVRPYMHSAGDFAYTQGYSNATVDIEIDLAVKTDNETLRCQLYYDLQRTFINECPTLMLVQHYGRAWMRSWVKGWYYNALHPGTPVRDRWKGYAGDLNGDMVVDVFDLVIVAAQFGRPIDPPLPITDPRADVNGDGVVDIFDLVIVAAEFGSGT